MYPTTARCQTDADIHTHDSAERDVAEPYVMNRKYATRSAVEPSWTLWCSAPTDLKTHHTPCPWGVATTTGTQAAVASNLACQWRLLPGWHREHVVPAFRSGPPPRAWGLWARPPTTYLVGGPRVPATGQLPFSA